MPSTRMTIKAKGLWVTGNDLDAPDGALAQADNVVISRDNIIETRRGMDVVSAKALTRIFPLKGRLLGYGGSILSYSAADVTSWTDYSGSYSAPTGYPLRLTESGGNAYFTTSVGVERLDSLTGTPEPSGVPPALDLQLTVSSGAGTTFPTANQLAYRSLFGKKDANGRVLLGAPSGRAVLANTSGSTKDVTIAGSLPSGIDSSYFFQIYRSVTSGGATVDPDDNLGLVYEGSVPTVKTATSLVRASGTVTVNATAHGYGVGTIVRISPGGSTGGVYCAVGSSSACATSSDGITWTARTIPTGSYRSVAWNGTVFAAVGNSVCATSPDGTTWTARTIPTGDYRSVAWNGSVFVAVGISVCATSPDGITWTTRTIPSGSYYGLAWNGSILVAVGNAVCATSPNGITWTSRTISPELFWSVTWNVSSFIAVGSSEACSVSSDGITWVPYSSAMSPGNWNGIASNGSIAAAIGYGICTTSPTGITWTSRTIPAGDYKDIIYANSQFVAIGNGSACATSPDGITWTARTISSGSYYGIAYSGALFPSGEKTIVTTATNSFTYTEAGGDGTLTASQTLTPLTFGALDTVPDGFIGSALYTNPNQDGILQQHDRPPMARDVAEFKGFLFAANLTDRATGMISLLATGGTNGLQVGDTVILNGLTHTAAAAESVSARKFQVFTAGTPSQNVRNTAASLIRVINRSLSSGAYAVDVSSSDGVPGQIRLTSYDFSSSIVVTFSRTTAWSPSAGIDVDPESFLNGIAWSRYQIPDGMPAVANRNRLGSNDKKILRLLATRESLWVLKEEGIWRITGDAGVWSMNPFDPTIRVVAPESAAVLDNAIYTLSEQGVVRITDSGVLVVSRPVETAILPLIATALRSKTSDLSFGVAYESDRKYMLWLPTETTDTLATQAYVLDIFTNSWTRRTDSAAHGLVNPVDDLLYRVDGTSAWQERKAYASTDLADRSYAVTITTSSGASVTLSDATNALVGDRLVQGTSSAQIVSKVSNTLTVDRSVTWANGAATVYRAISAIAVWTPRYSGALNHYKEVDLWFRTVAFYTANLQFATEISVAYEGTTFSGTDLGWAGAEQVGAIIRTLIPLEKARGAQLKIKWSHNQAHCPAQIQCLELVLSGQSVRVSK